MGGDHGASVVLPGLEKVLERRSDVEFLLFGREADVLPLLETLPRLDFVGRDREPVAGEVPNPIAPPPGCAFNPRCPFAEDRCRAERPELRDQPGGQRVACHAVEERRLPDWTPERVA